VREVTEEVREVTEELREVTEEVLSTSMSRRCAKFATQLLQQTAASVDDV